MRVFVRLTAACAAAGPVAAFAAGRAPAEIGAGNLLQVTLGLLFVVGAIFAAAWFLRRIGPSAGAAAGSMKILGSVPVGARERVVLLQVGEEQLVVGIAPGRVQTLHVLAQPITPPGPGAVVMDHGFAARLAAMLKQGRTS